MNLNLSRRKLLKLLSLLPLQSVTTLGFNSCASNAPIMLSTELGAAIDPSVGAAVLAWITASESKARAAGDQTTANALAKDKTSYTGVVRRPATLPSNLFPAIPEFSSNPYVKDLLLATAKIIATAPAPIVLSPSNNAKLEDLCADILTLLFAFCYPQSPRFEDAKLIAPMLDRFEVARVALSAGMGLGDFFFSTNLAEAHLLLFKSYPDLVPTSRRTAWLATLALNTEAVVAQAGVALSSGNQASAWINAQVRWMTALAYSDMAIDSRQHEVFITGGMKIMREGLLGDGGTHYTDYQNEVFSYHGIYVVSLARFSQIMGNSEALSLVRGTQWYYPLNLVAPRLAEYASAVTWKHYWNQSPAGEAGAVVALTTGNPYNQAITNAVPPTATPLLASLYRRVTPKPVPTDWLTYDQNIEGPRGVFGRYSFAATARSTQSSRRGKNTYVGCMSLYAPDATLPKGVSRDWSLNAALNLAFSEAQLQPGDNQENYKTQACLALEEHNATTVTQKFAALTTTHRLAIYGGTPTGWQGTQSWLMTPQRLVGLLQIEAIENQQSCGVSAVFSLLSGRDYWGTAKTLESLGSGLYRYGQLMVKLWAHDYQDAMTRQIGSWDFGDTTSGKTGLLVLRDAGSASGNPARTYPKGTRHHVLVEIYPDTSAAAKSVTLRRRDATLIDLELEESTGSRLRLLHNPANQEFSGSITDLNPSGWKKHVSGERMRADWLPPLPGGNGTQATDLTSANLVLPGFSHVVLER
jgi:hypothetical protein